MASDPSEIVTENMAEMCCGDVGLPSMALARDALEWAASDPAFRRAVVADVLAKVTMGDDGDFQGPFVEVPIIGEETAFPSPADLLSTLFPGSPDGE